jgi:hypothetical protein
MAHQYSVLTSMAWHGRAMILENSKGINGAAILKSPFEVAPGPRTTTLKKQRKGAP